MYFETVRNNLNIPTDLTLDAGNNYLKIMWSLMKFLFPKIFQQFSLSFSLLMFICSIDKLKKPTNHLYWPSVEIMTLGRRQTASPAVPSPESCLSEGWCLQQARRHLISDCVILRLWPTIRKCNLYDNCMRL